MDPRLIATSRLNANQLLLCFEVRSAIEAMRTKSDVKNAKNARMKAMGFGGDRQ